MRALKLLVAGMGVLLVGGIVFLIAALVNRAARPPGPPSAAAPGGRTIIELPAGARVAGTETTADRLVLRVALPEGGEELILLDLRSGARVATIEFRPGGSVADGKP